jgi:hypothetical protein
VLGIGYWCLPEIGVNFIDLNIVKYKSRGKIPLDQYLIPNTCSIEFDSNGVVIIYSEFTTGYSSIGD